MNNWFNMYQYYGVEIVNPLKENSPILCPSCEENKAYLSKSKGAWDCKLCHASGNFYTFLQLLQQRQLEEGDAGIVLNLAKTKELSYKLLVQRGVFEFEGKPWLPVYNRESKLVGARNYDFSQNLIYNPPDFCKMNFWEWDESKSLVFVFEADFDALAFIEMGGHEDFDCNVIGLPGANIRDQWISQFKDRDVVFCFDYDVLKGKEPNQFYPGEKGTELAYHKLRNVVKSFSWLNWENISATRPFDVRDLKIQFKASRSDFKSQVDLMVEQYTPMDGIASDEPVEKISAIPVESFAELCERYAEVIDVTPTFKKCLACAIATIISAKTRDLNALWMFLVGPSSSGKSTILNSFNGCYEQSIHRSSITKTALVSGRASDEGNDPSILPRLKNKCLIIKDLTMLLSSNSAEQEAVFGTLRDAYDQDLSLSYGNGQIRDYGDLNFSWLAGVTEVIHTFNRADVGERFLKVDIVDPAVNEFDSIKRAVQNKNTKANYDYLKQITKGFVNHLWQGNYDDPENLPEIPDDQADIITCAGLCISYLRTKTKMEKDGTLDFRFRKEFGHRVAIQLAKLARFLCVVFQKETLDTEELKEYVLKVTLDTCSSVKTELIWWAMKHYKKSGGVKLSDLEEDSCLTKATVSKHVRSMIETGILRKEGNVGDVGRPSVVYVPTDEFLTVWRGAGFDNFEYDMKKKTSIRINRGLRKK